MHFIVWMKSHYNLYLNCIYSSKCTATLQLNPLPSRRNTSTVHFQSITKTSVSLSKLTVFGCTKRSKAHEVEGTTQVALRWVLNLSFQKQEHKFPVAPVWFHFLQEKKAVYYHLTTSSLQHREPGLGCGDSLVRQLWLCSPDSLAVNMLHPSQGCGLLISKLAFR